MNRIVLFGGSGGLRSQLKPKLDKDYISKLANNPHLLGWLKDPNNIERFGFTENSFDPVRS